jgi:hypothetical protein
MRLCPVTNVVLPRYFLDEFKLVKHPETGRLWWAPGEIESPYPPISRADGGIQLPEEAHLSKESSSATDKLVQESMENPVEPTEANSEPRPEPAKSKHASRNTPAPPNAYILSRQTVYSAMMSKVPSKYRNGHAKLLARRSRYREVISGRDTVWRQDMGPFLLDLQRRRAVDMLLYLSEMCEGEEARRYLRPCKTWGDVKEVGTGGCVLWYPIKDDGQSGSWPTEEPGSIPDEYATIDVHGLKQTTRLAIHNLIMLLGAEQLDRLRQNSRIFRDNTLVWLGRKRTTDVQMRLWKLQGYLATHGQKT